jgi:hypothetical protein
VNRLLLTFATACLSLTARADATDAGEVLDAGDSSDAGVLPADLDAGEVIDAGQNDLADAGAPVGQSTAVTEAIDAGAVPTPKFTGIQGRVVDSRTGEGLIEATIKVVQGAKKSALTDLEGRYKLKLPPGKYELRVFYELYQGRRIQGVEVKAGVATQLNVELDPQSGSVQEVVVEAKVDRRKESALLQERKRAVVVSDSISAQEISRTADSSAGDAIKRTPSATLVDNRYVVLRGLGGRYALTTLNGAFMPSPEPDEPSVALDLFPTALVSDLNVVKTYSAELPAAFGGGLLTINTNTFPSNFELKAKLSVTGDTLTTFRTRPTDEVSFGENFGFRDGRRDLPNTFPPNGPLTPKTAVRAGVTAEEQEIAGKALPNEWLPTQSTALPNGTLGIQVGDTIRLGGEKRFGYLAAIQVGRREQTKRQSQGTVQLVDGELVNGSPAQTTIGALSGASSGLLNLGLQLSRNHEVNLLSLVLLNNEAVSTQQDGYDQGNTTNYLNYRQQFTQRQLYFNQLKGFSRFTELRDLEIAWQGNFSTVIRTEPDIRDSRYFEQDTDECTEGIDCKYSLRLQPNSAERFFLDLDEKSGGGSIAGSLVVRDVTLRVGGQGQLSVREFDGRRFRFLALDRVPQGLLSQSPESIFVPERIGPLNPNALFQLEETTLRNDRYSSSQFVGAAFVQADWKLSALLRLSGGLRYEGTRIKLDAESKFATGGAATPSVAKAYDDLVGGVNAVVSPTSNLNIRAAYGYTLARPTFRELAPFLFYDVVRRADVSGNPNLVQTRIHHGEVRAEWFPHEDEVFSASAFGKYFLNPIERVLAASNSNNAFSFQNSLAATVLGVELEGRTSLSRLTPTLKSFHVGANLSLIYSRIQLAAGQLGNTDRPLQGQSPYVVNAFVSWRGEKSGTDIGLFYNVYGPRVTEVALATLPDFYEQPVHRLDAAVTQALGGGFEVKLTVSNLLNQAVRIQQGPVEVLANQPGIQFGLSLGWTFTQDRKAK